MHAVRALRLPARRNVRFASESASTISTPKPGLSASVAGALSGAAAGTLVFYIWYQASGIAKVANTAKQTKQYIDSTAEKLKVQFKEITPDSNEAIQALKDTAYKYASFIPGGREYVDKIFQDLETVRSKHGEDVDSIVREAYGELRDTSKKGLTLETLSQMWEILSKHLQRLAGLAGDAGQDILSNHPELKERFGSSFQQLQQLGDELGPEAKKQIDDAWNQVKTILNSGVSLTSAEKIHQLMQDKKHQLQKLGEQTYKNGYEQIKSKLDQNPQVKQLVEQNEDFLKSGNVNEVLNKIQSALNSGNTLDLEKYIVRAKEKAQQDFSSGGLSEWLEMVPNGGKILPQLQKMKQIADARGQEAQQLAKDTMGDIEKVLQKRAQQAEELLQRGKKQ